MNLFSTVGAIAVACFCITLSSCVLPAVESVTATAMSMKALTHHEDCDNDSSGSDNFASKITDGIMSKFGVGNGS